MRLGIATGIVLIMMLVTNSTAVLGQPAAVDGRDALTRALDKAWLPLESGLVASAREGTPVSAKYEIDDGALQLSVYVMKSDATSGAAFAEVIVDHNTATVSKVDTITDGGDLSAAQTQHAAMARATRSLAEVTADAVKANAGYRALSAIPSLDNGRPVAEVTLVRGDDRKVVTEHLD